MAVARMYPMASLLAALVLCGCAGDVHVIHAPPSRPAAAEKWWAEEVDRMDPAFLRVLCEVSETHRTSGTAATYVLHYFKGCTMAGWYESETRLPVPLPEPVVERIRTRLAREEFSEQPSYAPSGPRRAEGGKGCSDEKAMAIWQDAKQKYGCRK